VILGTSLLLVILAVFNVYYVRILYKNLNGIVEQHGCHVLPPAGRGWGHVRHRGTWSPSTGTPSTWSHQHPYGVAGAHPAEMCAPTCARSPPMANIQQSMDLVARGMVIIDQRVHTMTGSVAVMRENVGQFARPMGGMMPFMP
jgi:hypothetical protein